MHNGDNVSVLWIAVFSFVLAHFLCQIVQALIVLGLRDGAALQETVEQRFLPQIQLMVFLLVGERRPVFVFNIHLYHREDYIISPAR